MSMLSPGASATETMVPVASLEQPVPRDTVHLEDHVDPVPPVLPHEQPRPRETVHLGAGGDLAPPALMEPPFKEDSRGILRDLAAFLLDRHLRRLARMRNPVDLRLGQLLARLESTSAPLTLGFARLADYTTERLGLSGRRARALIALARALEPLPRIGHAFSSGEISRSQTAILVRVATPATEAEWLGRARSLTFRRLAAAVKTAQSEEEPGHSPAAARVDAEPIDDEDAVAGSWIDVSVPQRVRGLWDQAVELARRCAGSSDPVSTCAEMIAADYLAGVPDLSARLARDATIEAMTSPEGMTDAASTDPRADSTMPRADSTDPRSDPAAPAPDSPRAGVAVPCSPHPGDTDLFEAVIRSLENENSGRCPTPPPEGLSVVLPASTEPRADDTARDLDRRLREFVRVRQNIAWHQGRLLRLFVDRRLYRELGFLSFARYCSERGGLGVRRAWDLIALERRLWLLPRIAAAYRSGELSWVKAACIARVASDVNEAAWLALATSITVRRLDEEVALAERREHARATGALPIGAGRLDTAPPDGLDAHGRVQMLAPPARARAAAQAQASGSGTPDGTDPGACDSPQAPASLASAPTTPAPTASVPTTSMPTASAWARIRFWAPLEIASLWRQAMRVAAASPAVQTSADWECLEQILTSFIETWSIRADADWQRNHRILERDGWRCRVPGCSSRQNLQVHHIVFRSHGGGDEDDNLAPLCATHHLQGIHQGRLRCHALPEGLLAWEFAPDPDGGFLARYVEDVAWDAARAALQ